MSQNIDTHTDDVSETLTTSRRQFLEVAGFAGLAGLTATASAETVSASPSSSPGTPGAVSNLSEYIEAPGVFAENQEPPRVHTSIPFDSVANARDANVPFTELESRLGNSPYFQSLNGDWEFAWYEKPADVPDSYANTDWDSVAVPGCWQTQGYDTYVYLNTQLTWEGIDDATNTTPPDVPDDYNPVGTYRRTFSVPTDWDSRESFLNFEGVKQACFVWIDDQYVGYNQGSMTSAEFNVTDYVSTGSDHTLTVQVYRFSDGEALETSDMFRWSGIYRSVYLYSTHSVHLRDFFIRTDLDDDYQDADLSVDAELANYTGESQGDHTVQAHLFDSDGSKVTSFEMTGTVDGTTGTTLSGSTTVTDPDKWTAETPRLYTIVLEHTSGESISETMFDSVGFREYSIADQQFRVNGEPVNIRGVNSHEHDPEHGRTVPMEKKKEDFELMKQYNVNALRCSHYPRDPTLYYLADEYGLYLEDEVGVETHWNINLLGQNDKWDAQAIERFRRMVQSDKNRPCIFMWGTGNEAGLHDAHFDMAEYITGEDEDGDGDAGAGVDSTRFLYHQANNGGTAPFADIVGPRYISPPDLASRVNSGDDRPLMMGEYAHAMGNSGGLFHDFWEIIQADAETVTETVFTDESAAGNDGTLVGDPRVVDEDNGAIVLNNDGYVDVGTDSSLDFDEPGFTVWAHVKDGSTEDDDPYVVRGDQQYGLKIISGDPIPNLQFFIYDRTNGWQTLNAPVPDNWTEGYHDAVGVATDSTLKIFVDGKLLAKKAHNASTLKPENYSYPVTVGYNPQKNRNTEATISQVRVYNRALSDSEVADAGSDSSPPSSAVLWMDFDQYSQNTELKEYHEYDRFQGGFVWDWVDQGVYRKRITGRTTPNAASDVTANVATDGETSLVKGASDGSSALEFDGSSTEVVFDDDPSLNITEPGFTLHARVDFDSIGRRVPIIGKGDFQYLLKLRDPGRSDRLEFFFVDPDQPKQYDAPGTYVTVAVALNDLPGDITSGYHDIVGVCTDSEMKLFMDGQLVGSSSHSGTSVYSSSTSASVGYNLEKNAHLDGVVDQARIYDRALSDSEIEDLPTSPDDSTVAWLDFDSVSGGNSVTERFYDGNPFCLNGVIFEDRTIQPQLEQLKKSHQPMGATATDAMLLDGRVRVTNYDPFRSTKYYDTSWELTENGSVVQSGDLSVNVDSLDDAEVAIPWDEDALTLHPGREYHLRLRFDLPEATPWAEKGHEVAFVEFKVPFDVPKPTKTAIEDLPSVTMSKNDGTVTVTGNGFEYVFDKSAGTIASGTSDGTTVLTKGPQLDFFRAPIQNEIQSWGAAESNEWFSLGLDSLKHETQSLWATAIDDSVAFVEIETSVRGAGSDAGYDVRYQYYVLGSGDVVLGVDAEPTDALVSGISYWIPRIGVAMDIPNSFGNLEWFGRGPEETYPDRKWSAKTAVHSGTVNDQYVKYQPPSDNGNKTDVRWAALTNGDGMGLAAFANPQTNLNIEQYANLTEADHNVDLVRKDGVYTVHLDDGVTGVGGTPVSTLEQYRVEPGPTSFQVTLRPYTVSKEDPMDMSLRQFDIDADAVVVPVQSGRTPTDPDGDGHYEDITGDGKVTAADGNALFKHFEDPEVQYHPKAYDFNDNGRLDLDDIVEWRKKRN